MELVFLEALQPITKTFTKVEDDTIQKSAYPNIYQVTSITEHCTDLKSFAALLSKHAALGHCLLKGTISRSLIKESRAGTTDTNASTKWVCLDIDSLPGCKDVEQFLSAVGLPNVSYIVQYSASSLIENKNLNAHLFMLLDSTQPAPLLKQWLIDLNHKTPLLSDAMHLTKTDTALHWPLDISVCQNDKLIYITPPILKKIKDPYAKNPRIKLVQKTTDKISIGTAITNITTNQLRTDKRVNELRELKGLNPRKFNMKLEDGLQILAKPDQATTYETRTDRGFVYFNLNGGDSWGYYHPEGNAKYIRNFKSEPTYLTKELLPEYWATIQTTEKEAQQEQASKIAKAPVELKSEGDTYLALTDRRTSTYWKGTYNATTNKLELTVARTAKHIIDFIKAHGLPYEDFIPEWDTVFDPSDAVRVDPVNKIINMFEPTIYMQAPTKNVANPPTLIYKIIDHALGGDPAITKHFINWLAYIVQFRTRTKTAWVFHGVEGTGKGTLFHCILRPIFGAGQTTMKRMGELTKNFNGFLENKFIVFIDEVQTKALLNESSIMADLRNYITEPTISVEQKYQLSKEIPNYANILFASNKPDPVAIPKNDRRFNVGKYQANKLVLGESELKQISNELQNFYHYLEGYKVDHIAVATPIESEERNNMVSISEESIETASSALLDGNFGYFIGELPTDDNYKANALQFNKFQAYSGTLKNLLARTKENGVCNIGRDELRVLYDYVVGEMPQTPNKFTSRLKHHRIHLVKVRIDKPVYGLRVVWKDTDQFNEYLETLDPPLAAPTKLKAVK